MKPNIIKIIFIITVSLVIIGCERIFDFTSPIRKDIEPTVLAKKLRNDSTMYAFKGYGVTPRDERFGAYLVSREKEYGLYHWVKYNPKGTKYVLYYDSFLIRDSVLIKLSNQDSIEILNKAHELIGICKKLDMRWASWQFGTFDCYFNDSTRMTYVENKDELDSSFYQFHNNLNWIDSNFVTYD